MVAAPALLALISNANKQALAAINPPQCRQFVRQECSALIRLARANGRSRTRYIVEVVPCLTAIWALVAVARNRYNYYPRINIGQGIVIDAQAVQYALDKRFYDYICCLAIAQKALFIYIATQIEGDASFRAIECM